MKRLLNRSGLLFGASLAIFFMLSMTLHTPVNATNPTTISFQGKVLNANGTNVTDGTYTFVFKLYSVASAGTALWTETQTSVTVTSGVFQVNLGSVCPFFTANACNSSTPIDFNANPALYLGITFNSDPAGEMTPRVQLQSTPYAYNADKVGGLTAAQLVQLSPSAAQSGNINLTGTGTNNITANGTVQGATITATGALQGATASIDSGAFAVNATGAISASTGLTSTGLVNIQDGTYTTDLTLVNDGQTAAPPTFPNSYVPAVTIASSERASSRPLFFGYTTGAAWAGYVSSGECASYTQMCLDFGSGATDYTALENVGTTLEVGGGDDGTFAALSLMATATNVTGTLGVTGLTSLNGGLGVTGSVTASTSVITPSLTSAGTTELVLNSGSGTLGLSTTVTTLQSTLAAGITLDLNNAANTTFTLENAGSGVANLNLFGGGLETAGTFRLSNSGALSAITGYAQTSGNAVFTQSAATNQVQVTASGAFSQTVDQEDISNTGTSGVVTAGVNALDLLYKGGAANIEASAERIDLTPGTTSGGVWDGLRFVPTTAVATGITENAIKIDAIASHTGTANAINIGTLYDEALVVNGVNVVTGAGLVGISAVSGSYTGITGVGALTAGSISGAFGIASTSAISTTANLSTSATGVTALTVSGAPVATATLSLVQIGAAIAAGNVTANGGTYLGLNAPASGAGSVADFLNFETAGTSKAKIDTNGTLTLTGAITGGESINSKATETAAVVYPITTPDAAYYFSSNTTTNATFTTTFNITGLPAVDGTSVAMTVVGAKGTTTAAQTHTTIVEINGTAIATVLSQAVAATGAGTNTRSFTVARINGVWTLTGEPPTTADVTSTSTATTADFAEWIPYSGDTKPQAGDVLSVGDSPVSVKQAALAYDPNVVGVVSTSPFEVAGADDGHSVVLALDGRVPVNVDLENGPIVAGDALSASSTPGYAMKATGAGRIIGTALSSYDGSQTTPQVTVLLGVGYDDPSANGSVLSSELTNNGALKLDTGDASNIQIDTASTGTLSIGTQNAGAVNISHSGKTTTVEGGLQVNQTAGFSGPVSMTFAGSQNLSLTSDLGGSVNGISFTGTPAATTTNAHGVFVQQAASSDPNAKGLDSGLSIDNANPTVPINSAISITNTGGAGYTNLISSPNFKVNNAGQISATGLQITLGTSGSFSVVTASGTALANVDVNGNASYAGSLNAASASLSGGLNVAGDSNFGGLSTFQKLATFIGKTVFRQDVEIDGHLNLSADSAGYASLRIGESTVHVTFKQPYDNPPVVEAVPMNGQYIIPSVSNITDQGFDIAIAAPATEALTLSWTAVGVINPVTATNPLPLVSTSPALVPDPTTTGN